MMFMYANLKVEVSEPGDKPRVIPAWQVKIERGVVTVFRDAQDGSGSYCEEDGEEVFPPPTGATPDAMLAAARAELADIGEACEYDEEKDSPVDNLIDYKNAVEELCMTLLVEKHRRAAVTIEIGASW